ncbi:glycine oxidase [Leifsonia sp. CL147]|nr:glycine oxidase [Leifsonia sp. CL154]SFL22627.1 glycine oxidase [Leifsonia sp. CL147]
MAGAVPGSEAVDVVVVGGGIIGLAIAWTVARAGPSVRVFDPAPARGATFAAAGMLAPVSEYHYQEDALLELMVASAERYPAFVEALAPGRIAAGYLPTETLLVGVDQGDRRALADLHAAHRARRLVADPISLAGLRTLEPCLGPRVTSGYRVCGDHQVDPRLLAKRLLAGLESAPAAGIVPERVVTLLHSDPADSGSRVVGVRGERGTTVTAAEVVLANGLGASGVGALPRGLLLPLRPVFGDILRLRVPDRLRPLLTATVRAFVRGESVYLVPRADGTLVIGATQREDGLAGVSAAGVHRLLRDAQEVLPAVAELEFLEATARARPATPDNAPLLGRVRIGDGDLPGLIVATGFFRHGVLLAPIAAEICLGLIERLPDDERWKGFRPDRFAPQDAALAAAERNTIR